MTHQEGKAKGMTLKSCLYHSHSTATPLKENNATAFAP